MKAKCVLKLMLPVLLLVCSLQVTMANNVRITRNVTVNGGDIFTIGGNQFATLDFGIAWDNSWRDDFNWDAVYVFVKCRRIGTTEWKHVSLRNTAHTVSAGYRCWVARSTVDDDASGAFIYRAEAGLGEAFVDVRLQWTITKDGFTKADFMSGQVEYSAMCIEMTYIPKGPFCIGDTRSLYSLGKKYRTILPEWDLIKNDGTLKFQGTGDPVTDANYTIYPFSNAANRVNETRSGDPSNAWYATQAKDALWQVEFPTVKTIRYFGVSGVRGYESYRPTQWNIYGSINGNPPWNKLMATDLTASDWECAEWDLYPVPRAIKIDNPNPYRFYQIKAIAASYAPVANCIAMTDVDIAVQAEDSYIVDRQSAINMNATTGFFTDAAGNGKNLNPSYPTGYEGFYAMKYEITQEQYVRFLNKLQPNQQKNRTIGGTLADLKEGEYVYGTDKSKPNVRNGIKLVARNEAGVASFVNDLDPQNSYGQDGDGQTLACNFLSPMDMLAYAEWTGLRPLSEMEYEKMVRGLYPVKPVQYEVAWNSTSDADIVFPSGMSDVENPGKRNEKIPTANVNAGNKIQGPVRVGSFAKGAGNQKLAGASYWGPMELSGNLAEIYYNVTTAEGREFDYILEAHGTGNLLPESTPATAGNPSVSAAYWPQAPRAFMPRGGSFITTSRYDLAVSARNNPDDYFATVNRKDSVISFRLGHSYTNLVESGNSEELLVQKCSTYLKLANGKTSTTNAAATDFACTGTPYYITGSPLLTSSTTTSTGTKDVVKKLDGKCDFVWWISENLGNTWRILPGQDSRDLEYRDFGNNSTTNRIVWIKRQAITPSYFSETAYIVLNIINTELKISNLKDTIQPTNQTKGILVETKSTADFSWIWKAKGVNSTPLQEVVKNSVSDYYSPERSHFGDVDKQNNIVVCHVTFQNACKRAVEVEIYVRERPKVAVASEDIVSKGTGTNRCGVMMQDTRETSIDGGIYGTVQIGDQCWMAENLRHMVGVYSMYQPKDPRGIRAGVLYSWNANVKDNACPTGWKVPTNNDFAILQDWVNALDQRSGRVGKMLKSGNQWNVTTANKLHRGDNLVGFGFVGAGSTNTGSDFRVGGYLISEEGNYWGVNNSTSDFTKSTASASNSWMPIRCIKR